MFWHRLLVFNISFCRPRESRENARASGEAARGRRKEPILFCFYQIPLDFSKNARLTSFSQIGELARRLTNKVLLLGKSRTSLFLVIST